eukprot:scaffold4330_cov38-Attheya_sp.AAC.4
MLDRSNKKCPNRDTIGRVFHIRWWLKASESNTIASLSTVADDDNEGNNNDDPKKQQMVHISAMVEHDERMSDGLGPVVLHDKICSLEMLPSVIIEWCARGGNGGGTVPTVVIVAM